MISFNTIKEKEKISELIEKKSRFIAQIFYIENLKEAEDILKMVKKKYYDARHNCYAYRVMQGEQIIQKSSDDGEPQGTAGAPILNVLEKNDLLNILVIVTRYFGGILLGTGGLVKAYTQSTINVIEETKIIQMEKGIEIKAIIPYSDFDTFKHLCIKEKIKIYDEKYNENIEIKLDISEEKYNYLYKNIEKLNLKNVKMEKIRNKFVEKCL